MSLLRKLRDAGDILKHVRDPRELGTLLRPATDDDVVVVNERSRVAEGAASEGGGGVSQALKQITNRLKGEVVDAEGQVDYGALKANAALYDELNAKSQELAGLDPEKLGDASDAEKLAFFINVYNVLSIHAVIARGIERSVMEQPTFFRTSAYRIAGHVLTLDEIENGVLRRNAAPPMARGPLFGPDDPRLAFRPNALDPRFHAALVCSSRSCPPVAFYDADSIERQLDVAMHGFVAATVGVNERGRPRLSAIFDWYRADFGGREGLKVFLLDHLDDENEREALRLAFARSDEWDVPRYDWTLNGKLT